MDKQTVILEVTWHFIVVCVWLCAVW